MCAMMQGTAHEDVELSRAWGIGNHGKGDVDIAKEVNLMRILNVMHNEISGHEPLLGRAGFRRGCVSCNQQAPHDDTTFQGSPIGPGEEGVHDRCLRIWVRR